MENHNAPNIRRGFSVIREVPRFTQGQSHIAPNLPQAPQPPQSPVVHQNRENLQTIPFNNTSNIPIVYSIPPPPQFTPQPQGFLGPVVPQQNTPIQMESQPCRCFRCIKMKCSKMPPPSSNSSQPKTVTLTVEQMEALEKELEDCQKRLLEREVKVKDLSNLVDMQGVEMGNKHQRLDWYKVKNADLKGTVDRLFGEILRLNNIVAEKNRALVDYQKTVEEWKGLNDKLQENNNALEGKLKETAEFMKNVHRDFKGGVDKLTGEYCEGSEMQLEEPENAEVVNEAKSVIEKVDEEKEKFKETSSVLIEFTEMGFQELQKRIDQLEEENGKVEEVAPVLKIHLRKVSSSGGNGNGSEDGESLDEKNGDGRWSVVSPEEGEREKEEEEEKDNDEYEIVEDFVGSETPPPVLYPYNVEFNEMSGEESGSYHHKIKRRRLTESSVENKNEEDENYKIDDHDDGQGDQEDEGNEKAEVVSEEMAAACELVGGVELPVDMDLGEQITLHYATGNEQTDDDGDAVMMEVNVIQPDAVMDDMTPKLSSGGQEEGYFDDDGPCSKIFCERCFTPFPSEKKLDRHHRKKSCSVERKKWKGIDGAENMKKSKTENIDEDELLDV